MVGIAVEADTCKDYERAIFLYNQAINFFEESLQSEKILSRREQIQSKVVEYFNRVCVLKQVLSHSSSLQTTPFQQTLGLQQHQPQLNQQDRIQQPFQWAPQQQQELSHPSQLEGHPQPLQPQQELHPSLQLQPEHTQPFQLQPELTRSFQLQLDPTQPLQLQPELYQPSILNQEHSHSLQLQQQLQQPHGSQQLQQPLQVPPSKSQVSTGNVFWMVYEYSSKFPVKSLNLQAALDLANEAQNQEKEQNYQEALDLYADVIERLMFVLKSNSDENQAKTLKEAVDSYLSRAEEIKVCFEHPTKLLKMLIITF